MFAYAENRQVKQIIKMDSRICLCQDRQIKQVMNEIEKAESPINQKEMIK